LIDDWKVLIPKKNATEIEKFRKLFPPGITGRRKMPQHERSSAKAARQ